MCHLVISKADDEEQEGNGLLDGGLFKMMKEETMKKALEYQASTNIHVYIWQKLSYWKWKLEVEIPKLLAR